MTRLPGATRWPAARLRPAGPKTMAITAVVAHDAGGAEVLSSYIAHERLDCRYVLEGPARAVFERKLGVLTLSTLADAVRVADSVLCGTSWQSDLELDAIRLARASGKPSVAWIDHWVNYRARFERAGVTTLPDELWVGDEWALALARQHLPELPVRLLDNPYFADVALSLAQEARIYPALPGQLAVLYVCEPIREHALLRYGDARHWGYTEEEALRYFLSNLAALGAPVGRIVIRPHPSEAPGKYADVAAEFDLPIQFSAGQTLSAQVASSDCVVGCSSMAMVVGLLAGKRVLSVIPPGGPACSLPQPDIESLRQMLARR